MNAAGTRRADVASAVVAAAQAGDERAFEAIVAHYRPPIYAMARRMTRDRGRAEDVVQDVLVRLWRSLGNFDTARPFRPWLMTVARNACLNAIARKRLPMVSVHTCSDENGVPEPASAEPSAPELLGQLADAIRQLPARYRRVVALRHIQGHSYREIARRLGRPSGTIKVWLFRARERLRRILGPARTTDGALA